MINLRPSAGYRIETWTSTLYIFLHFLATTSKRRTTIRSTADTPVPKAAMRNHRSIETVLQSYECYDVRTLQRNHMPPDMRNTQCTYGIVEADAIPSTRVIRVPMVKEHRKQSMSHISIQASIVVTIDPQSRVPGADPDAQGTRCARWETWTHHVGRCLTKS